MLPLCVLHRAFCSSTGTAPHFPFPDFFGKDFFIMNTTLNTTSEKLRRLTAIAMFCALSYICMFVFRIKVSFLTFDAKDAVTATGAMFFGPLSALVISAVVAVLEMFTVSDTAYYGCIMNFISSAAFSVTASLIYKYRRKLSGAILGLSCAVVVTTACMMVANLLITPSFMDVSRTAVQSMIPTLLLPFNLTKAFFNASLVLLLYKPVTRALRATGLVHMPVSSTPARGHKTTATVAIVAVILIALSIFTFLTLLNGQFELYGK